MNYEVGFLVFLPSPGADDASNVAIIGMAEHLAKGTGAATAGE